MIKTRRFRHIVLILVFIAGMLLLSACSAGVDEINPGGQDFNCTVTYNALGGIVNAREIRETYYMKNSYVFKPSGTSGKLIEPVKDGYLLAGWYTAKEDVKDANGNITGYSF